MSVRLLAPHLATCQPHYGSVLAGDYERSCFAFFVQLNITSRDALAGICTAFPSMRFSGNMKLGKAKTPTHIGIGKLKQGVQKLLYGIGKSGESLQIDGVVELLSIVGVRR